MGVALSYPQLYGKNFEQQILSDLKEMKENGISTVVDASPVTLGRDVKELKKVSEISGVNIIAKMCIRDSCHTDHQCFKEIRCAGCL